MTVNTLHLSITFNWHKSWVLRSYHGSLHAIVLSSELAVLKVK